MTVRGAAGLFKSHQDIHVRKKTRDSYRHLITNFGMLFAEMPVDAVSSEDVYHFLLIVTEGRMKSTARLRYAQLKASFNFVMEKGEIVSNPCDDPALTKVFRAPRRKDRDIIAREVIDEVIYRCRKPRDRLIMELQARCGLRIGEVLKLRVCDVNERKLVIDQPKSGREEEVAFMPEPIASRLKAHIGHLNLSGTERIFPLSPIRRQGPS